MPKQGLRRRREAEARGMEKAAIGLVGKHWRDKKVWEEGGSGRGALVVCIVNRVLSIAPPPQPHPLGPAPDRPTNPPHDNE